MKVGILATTNAKGQIVIPKKVRDAIGIGPRAMLNLVVAGRALYIYPVQEILVAAEAESSYGRLLEKTRGAWAGDDWEAKQSEKAKTELVASKRRKSTW